MTEKEAVIATMDCAKQIVQSYGPSSISQNDRDALCRTMEYYKQLFLKQADVKPWPKELK